MKLFHAQYTPRASLALGGGHEANAQRSSSKAQTGLVLFPAPRQVLPAHEFTHGQESPTCTSPYTEEKIAKIR